MTRILYWNNMPAPYMVGRFNALSKRPGVELHCLFTGRGDGDRSWSVDESSWDFGAEYCPIGTATSVKVAHFREVLRRQRPDVVVGLWSQPVYVRGFAVALSMSVPYVFRVLPSFESWFPPRRERELLKHVMFRAAAGATCSSAAAVARAEGYGMAAGRAHLVAQSIDLDLFRPGLHLEPRHPPRIGFVGRLIPEKGIDLLLAAMELVRVVHPFAELRVCGDGELEDQILEASASDTLTSYHGFVEGSDLVEFYRSIDILAFPTTGDPHGLVVDEALACGVPVVSSSTAGGIEERIIDGANGYIVGPRTPLALANGLCAAIARRDELVPLCRPSVAHRTHERWAVDVHAAAEAAATDGNGPASPWLRHAAGWAR